MLAGDLQDKQLPHHILVGIVEERRKCNECVSARLMNKTGDPEFIARFGTLRLISVENIVSLSIAYPAITIKSNATLWKELDK